MDIPLYFPLQGSEEKHADNAILFHLDLFEMRCVGTAPRNASI